MKERVSKLLADTARIFMPPFSGLPFVMCCYFIFSYMAVPGNPVWRGDLPDPDDYTYLSHTLDWLQGQGWFDTVQHRMNPPEGTPIHYTRIAELPIAVVIMLFRSFHYSWQGAALLGSFLLPVIYLAALFAALRFAAARFANPDWARLASFIVMFANVLMFKFAPGQVDHHGLEAILIIISTGLTAQAFSSPNQIRWGAISALVLALALAVALETLPWIALTAAVIGLWAAFSGAKAARSTATFAVALFLPSAALLALIKPSAEFLQPDLLSYSIAYVALTGGIALALLAASAAARIHNIKLRLFFCGGIALALGALYLWRFPDLLVGPYGAMDKKLASLFFSNLEEAEPMTARFGFFKNLLLLVSPMLGFITSLVFLRQSKDEKKWSWLLISSLLAAAIALAFFYQIRMLAYAQLFAVIPLVTLTEHGWVWVAAHHEDRLRFLAEIGLILLVGPLTSVLLPALQDGRSFNTGIVLFPAQTFDDSCEMRSIEKLLTSSPYAARAPLRIVNMIDQGPELLFRTPHEVLSAPYHTNVRGNLDALDFFSTTDAAQAEQIARRDGINLVVMCRNIPDMYLQGAGPHYVIFPNGEIRMRPNDSFAGQLAFHKIPGWLTEISVPKPSNYLLFEVKQ